MGGQSFAAFHAAYLAAALIALTGGVCAFVLIRDGDARATMVRRTVPRPAARPADPGRGCEPVARRPRAGPDAGPGSR